MPRKLSERNTKLVFETDAEVFDCGSRRAVVVEASSPRFITLHLKGLRTKYAFSWETAYRYAVQQEHERVRREKALAKKAAKGSK